MVTSLDCHTAGPGSIPGRTSFLFPFNFFFNWGWLISLCCQDYETRVHKLSLLGLSILDHGQVRRMWLPQLTAVWSRKSNWLSILQLKLIPPQEEATNRQLPVSTKGAKGTKPRETDPSKPHPQWYGFYQDRGRTRAPDVQHHQTPRWSPQTQTTSIARPNHVICIITHLRAFAQ